MDKDGYKLVDKNPQLNAKINSVSRAVLRIIRIIMAKGYMMVKNIDAQMNGLED